jgi:predicted glycoside hydrolase/deacetylase ChbG (UPF0249 family)
MIELITRGDDIGSCHAANVAVIECVAAGTLKNVSVMVPGPSFAEAAAMILPHMSAIDVGLHVTLNSEWDTYKWGPVSTDVPSLIEPNGCFTASPAILDERGFILEEALREARAQIHRARDAGLRLDYLDEHMGVGWLPGLRDGLHQIAAEEGLQTLESFDFLWDVPKTGFLDYIHRLDHGRYVYVTHPGTIDETTVGFTHIGLERGEVAAERDRERRLLTSTEFSQAIQDGLFTVRRFSEVTACAD